MLDHMKLANHAEPARQSSDRIDRSLVPARLMTSRAARVRFHPSGHLASVHVPGDRRYNGHLELAERPGSGHFTFLAHAGGYGVYTDERYRDGAVHSTLCSPWHDGEESEQPMDWRAWVRAALASLESLV